MEIRQLSWAGIEVHAEGQHLLVDAMEDASRFRHLLGEPLWPLARAESPLRRTDALVTHRHLDHFDPGLLRRSVRESGRVYCPAGMIEDVRGAGLECVAMQPWQTVQVGVFEVTAVPAVDWRGDDQISWVVAHNDQRLFHGGDTLWHGSWWNIQKRFGSFKVAMLPVNGVVAQFPEMEPSYLPATLTPEQAAVAGRLLKADFLCPMHYGQFNNPPVYAEQEEIETRLRRSADTEGIQLRFVPVWRSHSVMTESHQTPGGTDGFDAWRFGVKLSEKHRMMAA